MRLFSLRFSDISPLHDEEARRIRYRFSVFLRCDSVSRWRDSFGARKDNVSVSAYMQPDAFHRKQWRDNVSRYCRRLRARERRPRCRHGMLTRARRHVKFACGNASVCTCSCACVNDRAKSVDENEYARASVSARTTR